MSDETNTELAHFRSRAAAGLEPNPRAPAVREYLKSAQAAPVLGRPWAQLATTILDWSVGSTDRPESSDAVTAALAAAGAEIGVGRYCEERAVYLTPAFAPTTSDRARRTIHLGLDLFAAAGHPVYAPFSGQVHAFADNAAPLDYGPVILLQHQTNDGTAFWTLYGHLSRSSLVDLRIGQEIQAGQQIATMGTETENGGWPPHLHLQLLTDLVGMGVDVFGVAPRDEIDLWCSLSPDPALLLD